MNNLKGIIQNFIFVILLNLTNKGTENFISRAINALKTFKNHDK